MYHSDNQQVNSKRECQLSVCAIETLTMVSPRGRSEIPAESKLPPNRFNNVVLVKYVLMYSFEYYLSC